MTVILLQAVDAAATARKPVIRDIEWRTLESQDFYNLVKNKIEKTGGIIKLSSQ